MTDYGATRDSALLRCPYFFLQPPIGQSYNGAYLEFSRRSYSLIFRVTRKLAKKIKIAPPSALPPEDNPLLDWTANLFMASRWQCIMLTNSRSLYSVLMAGGGITNDRVFAKEALKCLHDYMEFDGIVDLFDSHIRPHVEEVQICKAGDRSVLGSMIDLIFHARIDLLESGLPGPLACIRLNSMPMASIEFAFPREQLLYLVKQIGK